MRWKTSWYCLLQHYGNPYRINEKQEYKKMNKSTITTIYSASIALLSLFFSCRKAEYVPVPQGEPVPVEEVTQTLGAFLDRPGYTLFKAMWEKSHLNDSLAAWGSKQPLTVFVPSDEAVSAAGYSAASIAARSAEELDSLLLYHIVTTRLDPEVLTPKLGNFKATTKLQGPYRRYVFSSEAPYVYEHYIGFTAENLIINGKPVGRFEGEAFTHGMLIPVDRFLIRPSKYTIEVLEEDPRFSIFLEVLRHNDDGYRSVNRKTLPWLSFDGTSFVTGQPRIRSLTLLVPTNEAFIEAGFPDAASVIRLNDRAPFNGFSGIQVSDSVLTYHQWGRHYYEGNWRNSTDSNPLIFFSNDLNNEMLGGYLVGRQTFSQPAYPVPFEFFQSEGRVSLRLKGSQQEPAEIVEPDIPTLNGPLHAVNKLFVPDGFNLDY